MSAPKYTRHITTVKRHKPKGEERQKKKKKKKPPFLIDCMHN